MRTRAGYGVFAVVLALTSHISLAAIKPAENVATYLKHGKAALARGNPEQAIADFGRAIALDPNSADAYLNRGSARQALNDADGAVKDFNHAIELDPRCFGAYINRGNLRQQADDFTG